ncbi:MAG: cupin domain-containing protein [Chloroflexi bacterium]|nr:cupin domain-containing protein [Chloroflexota bacterium]
MSGRERRDPDDRFAGDEHLFDLAAAAHDLEREEQEARDGHRQVTLVHDDGVTVVLFAFEAGGRLGSHSADGLVMINVIAGTIDVATATATHSMAAGSLLTLAAGVQHDVIAREPSQVLLTVHLRHG